MGQNHDVEARLRDDFLNPFWRAPGWDLENKADLLPENFALADGGLVWYKAGR
jgi:hypothetical protein